MKLNHPVLTCVQITSTYTEYSCMSLLKYFFIHFSFMETAQPVKFQAILITRM